MAQEETAELNRANETLSYSKEGKCQSSFV